VAISPRQFDTVSGDLFNGCDSLSADGDPLALLRFHSNLVHQNGATHNPAILTPFGPSRASFRTGRSPTTSRLAPKRVQKMGFPLSVPHVAPLDSLIGEWDRRCRVCSDGHKRRIFIEDTKKNPTPLRAPRTHGPTHKNKSSPNTAVLPKIPHSNCSKRVPSRPLRPRSCSASAQRPIWNTFGTVAVRDFWENGCTYTVLSHLGRQPARVGAALARPRVLQGDLVAFGRLPQHRHGM